MKKKTLCKIKLEEFFLFPKQLKLRHNNLKAKRKDSNYYSKKNL